MHTTRMPKRIFCGIMALCLLVTCCSASLLMALAGAADTVYVKSGEAYHAITGFEADDTVTINVGTAATNIKNNGDKSHKFTVGDNTFISSAITLNGSYPLSEADYLQFWLNNTTDTDQYLLGMNFTGSGFQYNVPAGKDALLIADGSTTETTVTWTDIRITGAGTIRSLLIPAGFVGYVRVSLAPEDLEVKVPAGAAFDADTFDRVTKISILFGNTATGGDIYMDDMGYICTLESAANTIYTKSTETYHAISGFEASDVATIANSSVNTVVKNNGYQSQKVTVGDNTFVSTNITLNASYALSEADYLQFWVKNAATTDQYLLGMNFTGSGFQYNVPAGKDALLIADGSTTETTVTWTDIRITGAGTIRSLLIPAGFVGYVRVSLAPEDLEVKVPASAAFDAATFDRTSKIGLNLGNTATGGDVYFDDLGYIVAPNLPPEEPVQPSVNTIYTKPTETYHAMSGFETGDTVTIANGATDTAVKNNGYQSQKVTVGNDTFVSTNITLNASYPLSEADYLQFWVKNAATTDQYLLGMNFTGDGFQYNVPAGKDALLIADGSTTETTVTWTDIRITGANTIRSLLIPAGFSGYVRVSIVPEDLEVKVPAGAAFDAATFDTTKRIGLNIGNQGAGGNVYLDDLGYVIVPDRDDEEPNGPATSNPVYLEKGDTYHAMTGFEKDDVATVNVGQASADVVNNGYQSHGFTVGDNTFVSANISLKATYPLSTAPYVQFWVKNSASTEQYLLALSFQGEDFQYNAPTGAPVWLITNGRKTESVWSSVKINGAGTVRGLAIPAGFSGYVRVSLAPEHLEAKVGAYSTATFDKTSRISFYLGNTATGGHVYLDDLGYIKNPNYVIPNDKDYQAANNPIYLEKNETYHAITGFEAEDAVLPNYGVSAIKVKNNGYRSYKIAVGDNTFGQTVFKLTESCPFATSQYLQLWVKNAASTDQYLLSVSLQGDGFQYNVPTGAPVWLITGGKKTETEWSSVKINKGGTMRGLLIPAGFSGYVRISLEPENLAPKLGTYHADTVNKTTRVSVYFGNTSTGGDLYFDDLGYITNPNYTGLGSGAAVSHPIYLEKGETFHELTGFEAGDRVASNTGVPGIDVKNNGYQSHRYKVGDNTFMKVELTLNDAYPLSDAHYVQFWLNNSAKKDQYLLSMSFQGDGFQYNVPTGTATWLISGNKKTESVWESVRINGAGTMRGLLIPAGFSGYVRIPVTLYDLQPKTGRYDSEVFDKTLRLSLYLGNTATGGNFYFDDIGYITNANEPVPDYDAPGKLATNEVFLNKGDKYHLITGFELDDTTSSVDPFNRQHHNVSSVKNNGHYSYQFTLPAADFVSARIKFESTDKMATSEYLQFWISNPSNNNIYLFNLSFTDGNSFQYNIKAGTEVFLLSDDESVAPRMAEWSSPNIGTFKGRSFAIPVGFSGYVRIPLNADAIEVKKPTDGAYKASTLAGATQLAFYIGNIDRARCAYMDDVMLIDGEEMEEIEPDYDVDYSMDVVISLYGQLFDEQGQPLKNATLVLNNYTITKTDSNGRFVLDGVSMGCHTLSIVDENYKVYAQTAIAIMPGDETILRGNYITKVKAATQLVVNMRVMGSSIKLLDVYEGKLDVDSYIPSDGDAAEENSGELLGYILWIAAGVVVVAAAVVAFLLIKRARKKKSVQVEGE